MANTIDTVLVQNPPPYPVVSQEKSLCAIFLCLEVSAKSLSFSHISNKSKNHYSILVFIKVGRGNRLTVAQL